MTVTEVLGAGGLELGGSAPVTVSHGGGQVAADVVVEWDFDNDGDYSEDVEDVTSLVVATESMTGRDWASSLTGKAGPGQLKLTLLNDDDRFSSFNADSPLTQAPFSLDTGRRIRVRTADAVAVDPVLLARDRFDGSGSLTGDELGNPWTDVTANVFAREGDSAGATMAVPQTRAAPADSATASVHVATLDPGSASWYAQIRWRFIDQDNRVGIVYRFDDADNYGVVYFTAGSALTSGEVRLAQRVAGTLSTVLTVTTEYRHDDFIGVRADDDDVFVYINGVEVIQGVGQAFDSASTVLGIFADWRNQRPPSVQEFYVWDRLPAETEGILWTGQVAAVNPSVQLGPQKFAEVTGEGTLLDLAGIEIAPPNSIGITGPTDGFESLGTITGIAVGSVLGRAGLLHPPGPLDPGTVTLGAVGMERGKALEMARAFEETELGFLYETNEGQIGFGGRDTRVGAEIEAWFTDDPGGPFGYSDIRLLDWRSQIINRVEAGVAPLLPTSLDFGAINDAITTITLPMPDEVNGAEVGDLFLIVIASAQTGNVWAIPPGWTEYRDAKNEVGRIRVYAKHVGEDDINDDVTFATGGASGHMASWQYLIKNWYGDIQQGIFVSAFHGYGGSSASKAQAGVNDPQVVFPPWAPEPSFVIINRAGMTGSATVDAHTDEWFAPNGTSSIRTIRSSATPQAALQAAYINTTDAVIDPSPFLQDDSVGRFSGFNSLESVTIAVRGYSGDTPQVQGGQTVVVDDLASQERHRMIRTHATASRLFKDEADAQAYCETVLIQYAEPRPVLELTFPATIAAAYRNQAIRRRVSDRIRVTANGQTGLGVDGEFFIENIRHRWSEAGKQWQVVWQLSPA